MITRRAFIRNLFIASLTPVVASAVYDSMGFTGELPEIDLGDGQVIYKENGWELDVRIKHHVGWDMSRYLIAWYLCNPKTLGTVGSEYGNALELRYPVVVEPHHAQALVNNFAKTAKRVRVPIRIALAANTLRLKLENMRLI